MRLVTASLLCWFVGSSIAQNVPTTSAVCRADFAWATNNRGQSPCLLAAYMEGACGSGYWNVPALPLGNRYDPPRAGQTNQCLCSSVTYSAISACGACQGSTWVTWPAWKVNCAPEHVRVSAYTVEIPKNTSIPQWAYIDPDATISSSFNVTLAREVAAQGVPDITVANSTAISSSMVPSSTAPVPTTTTPPERGQGPNAGLIAGATIGSVAVLTLIIALIFIALKMKKSSRASAAPSSQYINKWSKNVGQLAPSSWGGSVIGGDRDTTTSTSPTPMMIRSNPAVPVLRSGQQATLPSSPQGVALQYSDSSLHPSSPGKRKPGSHNQNVITPFILPPHSRSSSGHATSDLPFHSPSMAGLGASRLTSNLPNGDHLALPSYAPPSLPTPLYATPPGYEHGLTSNGYPDEKRRLRTVASSTPTSATHMQPNNTSFLPPRLYNPDDPTTYPQSVDHLGLSILTSPSTGTNNTNPLITSPRSSIGYTAGRPSTEGGYPHERGLPPSAWEGRHTVKSPAPTSPSPTNVHVSQLNSSSDSTHHRPRQSRTSSSTSMSSFPFVGGPGKLRQDGRDGSTSWSPNTRPSGEVESDFDPWKLTRGP